MYAIRQVKSFLENGMPLINEIEQPETMTRTESGINEMINDQTYNVTGEVFGRATSGLKSGVRGGEVSDLWTQPEIVGDICKLPRVFPFCHSTRQGLEQVFEHVERNPTDFGMHCLLNTQSISSPRTHPYRGYTILNGEGKIRQIEQLIGEQVEQQKPIWLVFSGMGIEDWRSGMGRELMKLDAFRRSIMRSCEIVRPFGINLMDIVQGTNGVNGVTGGDLVLPTLKSLIGLTCFQIALVDCLRQVGIKHDGLVGYSVAGELACGYAEQLLSQEQALLCAYYIGKCIQEAKGLPEGLMVKICDLTWEQMKQRCPQGVVPVCIDSVDQYLLTGPKTIVRDFLRQLQLEGVFVKEIQMQPESSNFALIHTPYMQTIVPVLRKYLECLNMTPKQKTQRWISSTVVDQPWSTYMSPVEHIINTLCNPVMFHNVVKQIPKNSIVIEVAPRSLVQTLLKKIMLQQSTMIGGGSYIQQTPVVIPLMPLFSYEQQQQVPVSDLLQHFLVQLGRLYLEGVNLDSYKLYVPSQWTQSVYPVPISHGLWSQISKWGIQPQPSTYVIQQTPYGTTTVVGTGVEGISTGLSGLTIGSLPSGVQTFKYCIDIENLLEKDSYLMGHQVNGRVLYPTTGYLYLVWKSLAQLCRPTGISQQYEVLSSVFGGCQDECLPGVCFENVQIHRATVLRDIFEQQQQQFGLPQGVKQIVFQVNIEPVSGQFELVEGRNVIVNGRVYVPTTGRQYPTIEGLTTFVEGGRRVGGGRFLGGYDDETVVSRLNGLEGQLSKYEIYQQFKKLGYEFNGEFQGIVGSNLNGTQGEVAWTGRWIPFLDALLQFNVLNQIQQGKRVQRVQGSLLLPTRIRQIVIEPRQHLNVRLGSVPVTYDPYTNKTVCGGVEINGLQLTPVVLPKGQFYPTISTSTQVPEYKQSLNFNSTEPQSFSFSPYFERTFDFESVLPEDYIFVDRPKVKTQLEQFLQSLPTFEGSEINSKVLQYREFSEYYLNECKHYLQHIITRVEQPTITLEPIVPTPLPKFFQDQLENLTIYHQTIKTQGPSQYEFIELLEGGYLLKFLKQVVSFYESQNKLSQLGQIALTESIKRLFLENFKFYKSIEDDLILNQLSRKNYFLKGFLDVILENVSVEKSRNFRVKSGLRILEISPSMGHFFGHKIQKLFRQNPELAGMPIEYHYLPLKTNSNNVEFADEYLREINENLRKIQMQPIEKLNCDFGLVNGKFMCTVPADLKEQYDVVILNNTLSGLLPYVESESEIKKWLKTSVEKIMNPTGFLFVHEHTKNFEFVDELNKIEQIFMSNSNEKSIQSIEHRQQQEKLRQQIKQLENLKESIVTSQQHDSCEKQFKINQQLKQLQKLQVPTTDEQSSTKKQQFQYQTEVEWPQIIEECGFFPVGIKSDSLLRSMFLYRRPVEGLLNEVKICIDEFLGDERESIETMGWLEKVKTTIQDQQVDRVWLICNKPIPKYTQIALITVINGLKTELGGEKLRCLFIMDFEPIQSGQLPIVQGSTVTGLLTGGLQSTQVFDLVRKADLYMNVFQNGKWGSLRLINQNEKQSDETNMTNKYNNRWSLKYNLPKTGFETNGLFNSQQTYIIVGGVDNEFGLELCQWMVQNGAHNLILTTKHNMVQIKSTEQYAKLRRLQKEYGFEFKIESSLELCEEFECFSLIKKVARVNGEFKSKIGGVFFLEGLQKDLKFNPVDSLVHLNEYTRTPAVMEDDAFFVIFTRHGVTSQNFLETSKKLSKQRNQEFGKHCLIVDWNDIFTGDLLVDINGQSYRQAFIKLENLLNEIIHPSVQSRGKYFYPVAYNLQSGPIAPVEPFGQNKKVILMPKRIIEKLNDVEKTDTQLPLFIIHPIEGHINMLKQWAKQMKFPVYGLQFTQEAMKCQTIEQLAEFYWQQIEKLYPTVYRIHLMGHSFGSVVAFEMSLKRSSRIASLILFDNGVTQSFLNCGVSRRPAQISELEALYKFYQQYVQPSMRIRGEDFIQTLSKMPTFDERVRYVVNQLIEKSQFSFEGFDLEQAAYSYVSRSIMLNKYMPQGQLNLSEIFYIKSTPSITTGDKTKSEQIEKSLEGIKQFFHGKVQLKTIDADFRTVFDGEIGSCIASILNEYLFKYLGY